MALTFKLQLFSHIVAGLANRWRHKRHFVRKGSISLSYHFQEWPVCHFLETMEIFLLVQFDQVWPQRHLLIKVVIIIHQKPYQLFGESVRINSFCKGRVREKLYLKKYSFYCSRLLMHIYTVQMKKVMTVVVKKN